MDKYIKFKEGKVAGCTQGAHKCLPTNTFNIKVCIFLLLINGDIEQNPITQNQIQTLSAFHLNVRSIRNKLEYIQYNFYDFDV